MGTKIKMFIDNWSYQDFNDFSEAMRTKDLETQFKLVDKLVTAWEYAVPIEEGIMALGLEESAEVIRTVMETIGAVTEEIDTEGVMVDLSKWNTARFFEFMKAGRAGNIKKVERMMHEVCTTEDVSPDAPLDFQDGARMMKAITEEYGRLISGKA